MIRPIHLGVMAAIYSLAKIRPVGPGDNLVPT
jgi:hypothetical protein